MLDRARVVTQYRAFADAEASAALLSKQGAHRIAHISPTTRRPEARFLHGKDWRSRVAGLQMAGREGATTRGATMSVRTNGGGRPLRVLVADDNRDAAGELVAIRVLLAQ